VVPAFEDHREAPPALGVRDWITELTAQRGHTLKVGDPSPANGHSAPPKSTLLERLADAHQEARLRDQLLLVDVLMYRDE
jgi:hypothetical protein